jgi:hypothetical protein
MAERPQNAALERFGATEKTETHESNGVEEATEPSSNQVDLVPFNEEKELKEGGYGW